MKKRLEIEISRPVREVFDFVIDPSNTPKWIDAIKREEMSELPVREGAVYLPFDANGESLGEYPITEFIDGETLTYKKDGTHYFAKYTFTPTDQDGTLIQYYAWEDDGDLSADPFTAEVFEKLKRILEEGEA